MARINDNRSTLQWFGLCLALVGIPVGLFLFFDIAVPLAKDAIQSGVTPTFGLTASLKIMTPIVFGIVGVNLFVHEKNESKDDD